MLERDLGPLISKEDDITLCHRRSVLSVKETATQIHAMDELIHCHPHLQDYLCDLNDYRSQQLSPQELAQLTDSPDILAGFKIPERSVSTQMLADWLLETVQGTPLIHFVGGQYIRDLHQSTDASWSINTDRQTLKGFKAVINALWHGRLAIDQQLGQPLPREWSHRYRRALFIRTSRPVSQPSAVVATGPFGDIKNYNNRDFYLSWYPAGLAVTGREVQPPEVSPLDEDTQQSLLDTTFEQMESYLPRIRHIREHMETCQVGSGWVYASADGLLSDPKATLHHRAGYGIYQKDSYFSVDTGKFCSAPALAERLSKRVTQWLGQTSIPNKS